VVSITVNPPVAPTINITSPANNTTFAAPASVSITVNAGVAGGGSVTNVTFYNNTAILGSNAVSPFGFTANNLAAASYALSAVATAAGISATSAVVNISVVSPVAVSNSAPNIAGGQFSFSYSSDPGLAYVIQDSSDLVTWLPVSTNVASANPSVFTDAAVTSGALFYRVVLQPNP
jgi:hypothetical protein